MKMNLKNVLFIFLSTLTLCSSVYRKKRSKHHGNGQPCENKWYGWRNNCEWGHSCEIQDIFDKSSPLICRKKVKIGDDCKFKVDKDVRYVLHHKCGKDNKIIRSIIYLFIYII
jgi:hypothetical protein